MAKIYLNVEADNPADLINALQGIITGGDHAAVININPGPVKVEKTEKGKKPEKATAETPATSPSDNSPVDPAAGTGGPAAAPQEDKKPEKVKPEEIRDALKKLGSEKARALVSEFGGAKLSEVPEEKYPELLAEAIKRAANG